MVNVTGVTTVHCNNSNRLIESVNDLAIGHACVFIKTLAR